MAQFKEAVLTRKGIALLAKAQAEHSTITFTKAVTGNGEYEDGESLYERTGLKNQQQEFAPSSVRRQNETNVFVHFSVTNYISEESYLANGYYVTEIGLIARDPDEGDILYGIAVADRDKADYLPSYNNLLPAVIGVDFLIEVSNAENVTIVTDISAYATSAELRRKGDNVAYDKETGKFTLRSGNTVISECTISFDEADLSAYARKDMLGIHYNTSSSKLELKHGDDVLSETELPTGGGGSADITIASEEDIRVLGEELIEEGGELPGGNVRIADDDEVEEVIENLNPI